MRRIIVTTPAEQDLHNILFYIAQHNKNAAIRLNETIYAKICALQDNPFIYRAGRVAWCSILASRVIIEPDIRRLYSRNNRHK